MNLVRIFSMAVCPFAQRTRILLRLKGVPFELTEIDICRPRPAWFLALNPSGQVPVILHQGKVLNESSMINEYLEEVYPDPPIFPVDLYRKALSRILIGYVDNAFVPAMYALLMNQDPKRHEALTERALETWRWLDVFLVRHNPDGIFLWNKFGMADLSLAPFVQRYCLNAWFRDFALPDKPEYRRVRIWRDALLAHPLTNASGMPDADFIKLYADYALGYGNGAVPPGHARSSFDLAVPLAERAMPQAPDWACRRRAA